MIQESYVTQILESKGYMITFGSYFEPIGLVDRKWSVRPDGQKERHFYGMMDRANYEHIIKTSKDATHAADRIEKFLTVGESMADPIDTLVERKVQEQLKAILGSLSKEQIVAAQVPAAEPEVADLRARVIADLEKRPGVARTKDGRIHESVIKAAMNRYEVPKEAVGPKVRQPVGKTPKNKNNWPEVAAKFNPSSVVEQASHDAEVEAIVRQANG